MPKFWLPLLLFASGCTGGETYVPMNGDILFQTSQSAQSAAIQLATGSRYSHMGIVYLRDGEPFVYEAVQPVRLTPLDAWVRRGRLGHFVAKRLKDAESLLTAETWRNMQAVGESFRGKAYDLYFEWSDDRIYCSELVWKIYQRGAGIEIGALARLGDFDLSHPIVRATLKERFGPTVPVGETVISPSAMFDSPKLRTLFDAGGASAPGS